MNKHFAQAYVVVDVHGATEYTTMDVYAMPAGIEVRTIGASVVQGYGVPTFGEWLDQLDDMVNEAVRRSGCVFYELSMSARIHESVSYVFDLFKPVCDDLMDVFDMDAQDVLNTYFNAIDNGSIPCAEL